MQTTENYAIFIHYQVPVITRITSLVFQKLIKMGKEYLIGSLEVCEELADEFVAVKEIENA